MESKYTLVSLIGRGTHGDVWHARSTSSGKDVAIKMERSGGLGSLKYEARVLSTLKHTKHTPSMYGFGRAADGRAYVAMTLLGDSLDVRLSCGVSMYRVAMDMLEAVRSFHEAGFVHRDVKPNNFRYGRDDPDTLYVIDYGLCKLYAVEGVSSYGVVGTPSFMSGAARNGRSQGKSHDLESWLYSIIYMWKGEVPWGDVSSPGRSGVRQEFLDVCGVFGTALLEVLRTARLSWVPDYAGCASAVNEMLQNA
jgi:serine/threonine protein kinase